MKRKPRRGAGISTAAAAGLAAALVLGTLGVFAGVRDFQFISYDDGVYVTANPTVRLGLTAAGARWAATSFVGGNWHPLTWLSHMLDQELFGAWAGGHHLTSVVIHAAAACLLFAALLRLTGAPWRSALVAALFAWHPLRVESVAWVAERKDVLSAVFWMLTLLAWARYAERPAAARYAAVLTCFALGLMAKPMVVTLPCVLLLLDYWPLGRLRPPRSGVAAAGIPFSRLLLEKTPLLLLSAASSVVTLLAQRGDAAVRSTDQYTSAIRAGNALLSYVQYLRLTLWPTGLIPYYPHPGPIPAPQLIGAAALLLALSAIAVLVARSRPYLLVGWLWFLGTLVPVIGIVQVGGQGMADRYTYLPVVGIFLAVVWAVAGLVRGRPAWRALAAGAGAAVLVALALLTRAQADHWRDDPTLYRYTLTVDPNNYLALGNLGGHLMGEGQTAEAGEFFARAYRSNPLLRAEVQRRTGLKLLEQGRREEALGYLRRAVEIDPRNEDARDALRNALAGTTAHIRERFRPLIAAGGPGAAPAWHQQGLAFARERLHEEARESLLEALRLRPDLAEAHSDLGVVCANLGRYREADAAFAAALRLRPDLPQALAGRELLRPVLGR
ncbi:MAG TPA: tetratricopeptide repeat protein [Candidatus Methanoperedens sp.]|nr:tetratricopeptide repeat protein [Candidatus Methanoperedens sp.]